MESKKLDIPFEKIPEDEINGAEDDTHAEDDSLKRVNPFARFAFSKPATKTQNSSRISSNLGKRKYDHVDLSPASVTRQKVSKTFSPTKKSTSSPTKSKVRVYDDLRELEDHLAVGLDILFCGINPGKQSAEIGHHYGNPNNHFWSCLHESGLTSRRLDPREDASLPTRFSIGLTNLVARPTVEQVELSRTEQVSGVSILLEKVVKYRPRIVCFVGLGIADIFKSETILPDDATAKIKGKKGKSKEKATVGIQCYKLIHRDAEGTHGETLFFAVSSTSGRVVYYQKSDKVQQFRDLRIFLEGLKAGTVNTSNIPAITIS